MKRVYLYYHTHLFLIYFSHFIQRSIQQQLHTNTIKHTCKHIIVSQFSMLMYTVSCRPTHAIYKSLYIMLLSENVKEKKHSEEKYAINK